MCRSFKQRYGAEKTASLVFLVLLCLLFLAHPLQYSFAASSPQLQSANSAITIAFSETSQARQNGGNVTLLVEELNSALALVQKANYENTSNPLLATQDLQNATNIANLVQSQAGAVSSQGSAAKTAQTEESIAGAVVIVALAILTYLYGGRIYRQVWFFLYKNHTVRRVQ